MAGGGRPVTRQVIVSFALFVLGLLAAVGAVLVSGVGTDTAGDPVAIERALVAGANVPPATPVPASGPTVGVPTTPPHEATPRPSPSQPQSPGTSVPSALWPTTRNARLGTSGSALPAPVNLQIPSIDVDAPIDPYGVNAETGEMEVPDNVSDVAWYRHGSRPGEAGSAVLAAHVDLYGQGPGVFYDLIDLQAGQIVAVGFADGSVREFEVRARTTYLKDELPVEAIFSRSGPSVLTLITCGGGFDSSNRRYDSNVVVYAVPVEAAMEAGVRRR